MDAYEKMDIVQNELENSAIQLMHKYELTEYAMVRAIIGVENTMRKCALARKAYSSQYADHQIKENADKEETIPLMESENQDEVMEDG